MHLWLFGGLFFSANQAKNRPLFHQGLRDVGKIILCISPIIALRDALPRFADGGVLDFCYPQVDVSYLV